MPEVPRTLIVVGGGVIAVEYTCMFATLGVRGHPDRKASTPARIRRYRNGWKPSVTTCGTAGLRCASTKRWDSVEDCGNAVVAKLKSNKTITGDALLYAVGLVRQR